MFAPACTVKMSFKRRPMVVERPAERDAYVASIPLTMFVDTVESSDTGNGPLVGHPSVGELVGGPIGVGIGAPIMLPAAVPTQSS